MLAATGDSSNAPFSLPSQIIRGEVPKDSLPSMQEYEQSAAARRSAMLGGREQQRTGSGLSPLIRTTSA